MTVWLSNLAAYSIQLAVVVATAAAVTSLLGLRQPRAAVAFWQALLVAALLLPLLQPWTVRASRLFPPCVDGRMPERGAAVKHRSGPSRRLPPHAADRWPEGYARLISTDIVGAAPHGCLQEVSRSCHPGATPAGRKVLNQLICSAIFAISPVGLIFHNYPRGRVSRWSTTVQHADSREGLQRRISIPASQDTPILCKEFTGFATPVPPTDRGGHMRATIFGILIGSFHGRLADDARRRPFPPSFHRIPEQLGRVALRLRRAVNSSTAAMRLPLTRLRNPAAFPRQRQQRPPGPPRDDVAPSRRSRGSPVDCASHRATRVA